jgi:hypothetical protein
VPEISRFLGMIITMYYNDYAPAHFHVRYGEQRAKIDLESGELLDGRLPRRALELVREWRVINEQELRENSQRALAREPLNKIEPLE